MKNLFRAFFMPGDLGTAALKTVGYAPGNVPVVPMPLSVMEITKTITPIRTTGNVTINTPAGTVNFAANASTLTVTSSLCTPTSIILPTIMTNQGDITNVCIVPGTGSFTMTVQPVSSSMVVTVGFLISA